MSLSEAQHIYFDEEWPPVVADSPYYPVGRSKQAAGRVVAGWQPDGLGTYFVLRRSDGLCIGDLSFDVNSNLGQAWISIEIAHAVQKLAYGREAIKAAAEWAMDQPHIEAVWLEILATNLASQRMALGAGFE